MLLPTWLSNKILRNEKKALWRICCFWKKIVLFWRYQKNCGNLHLKSKLRTFEVNRVFKTHVNAFEPSVLTSFAIEFSDKRMLRQFFWYLQNNTFFFRKQQNLQRAFFSFLRILLESQVGRSVTLQLCVTAEIFREFERCTHQVRNTLIFFRKVTNVAV